MNPPDWQRLLQQGIGAVQARQGTKALEFLLQARELQADSRDVAYWLGNAQRLCQQTTQAEKSFRQLLVRDPLDFESALALAFLLREQARLNELNDLLVRFARQPSTQTLALLQIAGMLRDCNQFLGAIEVMQLVLCQPDQQTQDQQAIHHFRLARLYQGAGQHQAALQAYRETLYRNSELGGAWLGLATLQQFTDAGNKDWQMLVAANSDQANSETAMCIAFARAKGFDDFGEHAQAWSHYLEGNRLRQQSQVWDRKAWQNLKDQAWSAPLTPKVEAAPLRKPVFIVGMLRSGTTLLEQLLAENPTVTARGELNFVAHAWKRWQQGPASSELAGQLGAQIWAHMRQDGPEASCFIDKNPLNFRFLPLLSACLPEARILHLRRDGRDTCLSCFQQLFQHPDSAFSNQLDDLAQFYHDYLQLMRQFEQAMPGQILTVAYEDLVLDSHAALTAVWKFLDVQSLETSGYESGVVMAQRPIRTASAWQARQAIHTRSLGRWRNYYEFAPGFFDRIAELDQQLRAPPDKSESF